MNHALRFFALATLFGSVMAFAQVAALNTPTDPRSIALGESMVSVPANPAAFMFNPAGLSALEGVSANYAHRQSELNSEGAGVMSGSASVRTSIGTLGLLYSRCSLGKVRITDATHPEGTGEFMEDYDELFGIGIAHQFSENWSAGLAIKTVRSEEWMFGSASVTYPYLVDFGLLFTLPDIFSAQKFRDRLTVGLAAQNMGTDYRVKESASRYPVIYNANEYLLPVPRYLHLGFSYGLTSVPTGNTDLSAAGLLITAEYRALTNPSGNPRARDYWGLGLELSLYEIVKARLGGSARPYTSWYGSKGTLKARYGFGLFLPLRLIGVPIALAGDYANIPLDSASGVASSLNIYSFTLQLDTTAF